MQSDAMLQFHDSLLKDILFFIRLPNERARFVESGYSIAVRLLRACWNGCGKIELGSNTCQSTDLTGPMGSAVGVASSDAFSLDSLVVVAKSNPTAFAKGHSHEIDERELADNPGLFCTLSTLLGRKPVKQSQYTTPSSIGLQQNFSFIEHSNFDIFNMDGDNGRSKLKTFMESHKLNTLSAIQAECQGLLSLEAMDPFFENEQFMLSMLNISNNQLTRQSLKSSKVQLSRCLLQLNIGGNSFSTMQDIIPNLPSSLLILDVSFTEGLQFPKGVFLSCPQLLQLAVDGCGITSTVFGEDGDDTGDCALAKACSSSIFYGLVNLVNLSIKENALESADDLKGLAFFAVQNNQVSTNNEEYNLGWEPKLRNISIAENPLCETSAELKRALSFITNTLPSVQKVDDKVVRSAAAPEAAVDRSSTQFRKQHAAEQALREGERGSAVVSDAMEREFTAALRSEKDNAVVS